MAEGKITNLTATVGRDRLLQDTVYTDATQTTAQDLTGLNMTFVLHAYNNPNIVFLTKDNGANGGLSITDPTNGILQVTINAADTAGFLPDEYSYFVAINNPGNYTQVSSGLLTMYLP